MKSIHIPLQAARIIPEMDLMVREVGNWIVFGGLVREPDFELTRMAAEFWEDGRCNGKIVRKSDRKHVLAVDASRTTEWWPCDGAMENIDARALQTMGVGEVQWFGALGSAKNPLHAAYRLKGGEWVAGNQDWSWRQALQEMMAHANISEDNADLRRIRQEAAQFYAHGVLAEHRKIRSGDVYGVVAYATQKKSPHIRQPDFDFEVWGHVGHEHALASLNDALDEVEHQVGW